MTDKQEYWKKKYADIHIRLTNEIAELQEQLERKEEDCERLKEQLFSFMNGDYCANSCSLKQLLDHLKAENEELEYIIANKSCLTYRDFKCTKAYYTDKRLKQALQEIKEIADGMHDLWINKTPYTDIDNLVKHLLECELNRIRYKFDDISEVE